MNKQELKPCPFCGKRAEINEYKGMWEIRCPNVNCSIYCTTQRFYNKSDAIIAWNTRKGEKQDEET